MILFPRFPGSKADYPIWDGGTFTAVVECFGGSAIFSQQMMRRGVKQVFIADTDPTVKAVYSIWKTPHLHHDFYLELQAFQKYVARDPVMAWDCLKSNLDYPEGHSTARIAAASLVLRHLTFGGVVRCSANGKLNVSYCDERLAVLARWRYTLPPIPKGCQVNIYDDWGDCVNGFERWAANQPNGRAIALLDPPYFSDRSAGIRMTPAYPGHQPHDLRTLDLTFNPLQRLLQVPQVKRLVVTNYVSTAITNQMKLFAECCDMPMKFTQLKKLDQIQGAHLSKTQNVEGMWEFGIPAQQQQNLFDLIAAN